MRLFSKVLFANLIIVIGAHAETYYIAYTAGSDSNAGTSRDVPWKRAPGMNGFSATYSHAPGDRFVFIGGDTWPVSCFAWNISNSGSPSTPDTYTSDAEWFTGASWAKPILDGGNSNPAIDPFIYVTGSNIVFDKFVIQNVGVENVAQGNYVFQARNSSGLTITNNTIAPYGRICFYVMKTSPGTASDIEIAHNDVSKCAWGINVSVAGAGAVFDNVSVHDNLIHDFKTQIGNGLHGDGIFLYGQLDDMTQFIQNWKIYGNTFYGDFSRGFGTSGGMTAFIYVSVLTHSGYIFNNSGGYSDMNPGGMNSFIMVNGETDFGSQPDAKATIANNSFSGDDDTYFCFSARYLTQLTYRNNVCSGAGSGLYLLGADTVSGVSSDYNIYHDVSYTNFVNWNLVPSPYTDFTGLYGQEAHGSVSAPVFTSVTDPANFALQPTSPAIGAGVDLSSLGITALNSDKAGVARGTVWDIGAFEYAPPPPRNKSASGSTLRGVTIR